LEGFASQAAAWVQAIGTILAVVGAGWVSAGDSRAARLREDRARLEGLRKEERSDRATRSAALNLAILAAGQIHDLHILLLDESWQGRVFRVSPSRTVLATERMLTAFPIQSLGDAPAMVAFSRFPAALATAAEVYANLEAAVRAEGADKRGAIFTEFEKQMARLDERAKAYLKDLSAALRLDLDEYTKGAAHMIVSAGPALAADVAAGPHEGGPASIAI
jgi:hypothetical protein